MDKCKDCGMQEPHWCCYSPEPTIEERLGKIESQLSELIELLSCDDCDCESPEDMAKKFHEAYERLAPEFGYATKKDSAVHWDYVPKENKNLMIAVCKELYCDCEDEEEPTPDIHFEDGECTICDKCEKCDETLCQCDCVDPSVPSKWAQEPRGGV